MQSEQKPEGILLIDKEAGVDSNCIVDILKRRLNRAKTGHAGTLDPLASGLLIVCIGRKYTKLVADLQQKEKEYIATIQLGQTSRTYDRAGVRTSQLYGNISYTFSELQKAVTVSIPIGEQIQSVPSYSALKINGKKMMDLARKGETPEKWNRIRILERELLEWNEQTSKLSIRLKVSKGTYIRSIAQKIGQDLTCGALLHSLRRTASGGYSVKNAHQLRDVVTAFEENYEEAIKQLLLKELPCS